MVLFSYLYLKSIYLSECEMFFGSVVFSYFIYSFGYLTRSWIHTALCVISLSTLSYYGIYFYFYYYYSDPLSHSIKSKLLLTSPMYVAALLRLRRTRLEVSLPLCFLFFGAFFVKQLKIFETVPIDHEVPPSVGQGPIDHEVPSPVDQKTIDPRIKALKLHCVVCMDDENESVFIRPCAHVLCKDHFTQLQKANHPCPLCKAKMEDEPSICPCFESVLFQCAKCKAIPAAVESKLSNDDDDKKLHVCCYRTTKDKDGGKSPEHVFCSKCYGEIMSLDPSAKDCVQRLPPNALSYVRYSKGDELDKSGRLMLKKKHLKYFGQE